MLLALAVCVAARSGSPKTKGDGGAELSLGGEGGEGGEGGKPEKPEKPRSLHLAAYNGACAPLEAEP